MKYELTIKLQLESRSHQEHVAKQFTALFDFGTVRESIVDGLKLTEEPRLLGVSVQRNTERKRR
jgi:hypothetical protein